MGKSTNDERVDMGLYNNGHPHSKKQGFNHDSGKPKILSLPVDRGGCGWYRVRQIFRELIRQGLADVHILDGKESQEQLEASIQVADVILARNGTDQMVELIKSRYGKKVVFDHDDNTFGILPSNQHYVDHGTEDVWVPIPGEEDVRPLWVTGVTNGFDKYRNLRRQLDLRFILASSDLVTSPTAHLSGFWKNFNDNVAMIPNLISKEYYPPKWDTKDKGKENLRIGWQGGVSHFGDIESVHKPLRSILQSNKTVEMHMVGSSYPVLFKGYESRVQTYPWIDFQAHGYRMRSLDLDIAIIPLADQEFNTFKSEIKFTELAALGVPCLVKDMKPYVVDDEICVDGVNCLTYKTEAEFKEKLQMLIDDPKLRKDLAKRAKAWAYKNRDLEKWAPAILETWLEL